MTHASMFHCPQSINPHCSDRSRLAKCIQDRDDGLDPPPTPSLRDGRGETFSDDTTRPCSRIQTRCRTGVQPSSQVSFQVFSTVFELDHLRGVGMVLTWLCDCPPRRFGSVPPSSGGGNASMDAPVSRRRSTQTLSVNAR